MKEGLENVPDPVSLSVNKYIRLIESFLCEKISASEYENTYYLYFKNNEPGIPQDISLILCDLFCEIDAFCPDPNLFDEKWSIDEKELRRKSKEALEKLLKLTQAERQGRPSIENDDV